MSFKDIMELIAILPNLIIYLAPGYIALKVLGFLKLSKVNDTKEVFIKSVVLSYFIINFEKGIIWIIHKITSQDIWIFNSNDPGTILCSITVSLVVAYCWHQLSASTLFENIMTKLRINKSIHDNVFENILNKNEGAWVTLYLLNEGITYIGMLRYYEQKNNKDDFYIAISNYSSYDEKMNVIKDNTSADNEWVVINGKTISRFEITNKQKVCETKAKNTQDKLLIKKANEKTKKLL